MTSTPDLSATARLRPLLQHLLCLLSLLALAAPAAHARQAAGAQAPPATAERPPADPFDRGTPRSTALGYLLAGREGRWQDAAQHLDLSLLPPEQRAEMGPRLARQLKIVLDQKLWISLDKVSDEPAGVLDDGLAASRELLGTLDHERGDFDLFVDRVPREGDGVLIWKIAASSLERVPALYEQYGYGPIAELLPQILTDTHFLEMALWQWLGVLVLMFAAWIGAWVLTALLTRIVRPLTQRSRTDLDDKLLELTIGPLRLLATLGLFNASLGLLHLSVPSKSIAHGTSTVLVIAGMAWLVFRIIDLFASIVRQNLTERGQLGATHLVPLGARALKVAVGAMTLLATLDTFGFDITAIIAGLGVGGLAVALAAQKTVENVFGGVSVLLDQPVRPGDFCKFGDKTGTVEDIGLRSTRIRTLDRSVISVPNAEFSTMQLENLTKRDRIRMLTVIGVRYETTPDQLRHLIGALRRLLLSHPKVLPEPQRVRFTGFGAYSLDLELMAYVDTADFVEFLAVREDILLRVMEVVAESGTGFAFPSSTTYLARDGGLDKQRSRAAEAAVAQWRQEGRLMFPDYTADEIQAMDDTLDWPPKGSPAAAR